MQVGYYVDSVFVSRGDGGNVRLKVGDPAFGTDNDGAALVRNSAGDAGSLCLCGSYRAGHNENQDEHGMLHRTSSRLRLDAAITARCAQVSGNNLQCVGLSGEIGDVVYFARV
jgi:hypothetical protein